MKSFRMRRPQAVPLLFIVVATALCVSLGIWQLKRLEWKTALLAQVETAQSQPALGNISPTLLPSQIPELAYRKAVFTGKWMEDRRLRFVGRKSSGYVWYAPLRLEDSDTVVLVALPWLPAGEEPQLAPGPATVEGVLRPPQTRRLFSPDNLPEKNLWFTEDMDALQAAAGSKLFPLILDGGARPVLRNDHLGYAITWFLLAITGIVMFLIYHREKH